MIKQFSVIKWLSVIKPCSVVAGVMCVSLAAEAAPKLYGKANVSYANVKADSGTEETSLVELQSNASRIGIKGAERVSDTVEAIYQAEFEVYFDNGNSEDDGSGDIFKQRNIFVGVKGGFGSVIVGHFDTPLRRIQKRVDLFDDLYGDIKHYFTVNENRTSNSMMYVSPKMAGFSFYGDLIASEDDEISNGTSLAVTYDNGGFYGAFAYDLDVEADGASATRGVIQYNMRALQVGLLVEENEDLNGDKTDGVFTSLEYLIKGWALKAQYGQSDISKVDGETLSLGVDYKLGKKAKLYGFFTMNGETVVVASTTAEASEDSAGIGIEVKF